MKTKNNPQQQKSDAIFLKYGTARKGQHLVTVLQRMPDGKKQIIGRIFRSWDEENKKFRYLAKDSSGKDVFAPTHNLFDLENQFKEKIASEKSPAEKNVPKVQQEEPVKAKSTRENEIKEVRGKNTGRENDKGITR